MRSSLLRALVCWAVLLAGCSRGGGTGTASGPAGAADLQQAFVKAVERAVPTVVNIRTVTAFPRGKASPRTDRQKVQDYLSDMMEENGGVRENSLGSGVIVGEDGLIVTNEHVVRDADEIIVRLWNRAEYPARVVGADARTDVALLRIRPSGRLPVAVLGDSTRLKVGEWAIAVGNPFGLESTVTLGVISATGRTDLGVEATDDFVQTDASINPGNSGGPLLNTRGEVVGINTAMVSAGQGIGFAIPINTVMSVERELARNGAVRRGWLGVGIQTLTPELAESFGVKEEKGILVNRVSPRSPAEKGGLRGGDIITVFGGKPTAGVKEFQKQVAATPPGSAVSLEILRGGKRARVEVRIAELEGQEMRPQPRKAPVDAWGLAVVGIPARVLRGLEIEGGVEVGFVDAAGPAWEGGIREGDVLLRVNREPLTGVDAYRRAMAGLSRGQMVSVLLLRDGAQMYAAFRTRSENPTGGVR
ncbi:MAG: Do family serine endopeptidase [Deltaproteobacteria bacterium]|nr:Do family serine endopeptidase [Deltaproteobacteria bacterium]